MANGDTGGFTSDRTGVHDDGSVGDATGDYSAWDWKHIMAAITGSGAGTGDDQRAQATSDPQTIQDAADTFYYVQRVLNEVGKSIGEQSEALTGEGGPWQGEAAQSFRTVMGSFSKQVGAMSDVLSGGITGDENVPQQLANNAQHLREAIAKVGDINTWYANQALKMNPNAQMANGLVSVHDSPPIPEMMGNDMRQVLTALAKHYKTNQDALAQPASPQNPTSQPTDAPPNVDDNTPNYYSNIPTQDSNIPTQDSNVPNYKSNIPTQDSDIPNESTLGPGSNSKLDQPQDDSPYSPVSDPVVSPYGSSAPLSGDAGAAPLDTSPVSPLDQNASAFPGGTSLDQPGPSLSPNGQLDPVMDAALNPNASGGSGANAPAIVPFSALGSGTGTPDNSTKRAASPYTGDLGLNDPGTAGDAIPTDTGSADIPAYSAASQPSLDTAGTPAPYAGGRSEERRVGKEC